MTKRKLFPYLKVEDDVERKQYPLSSYSVLFSDMDQHYKTLVETLPGVVYALDERGHFAYVSDTVDSVLGYSADDLIGLHFSNIVHPDDLPAVSRDCILPKFTGISTGNERAPKLFDERRAPPRRTTGLRMRLIAKKNNNGEKKSVACNVNASGQHASTKGHDFLGTVGVIFDCSSEDLLAARLEKKRNYNPFELLSQAMRHTFSNVFTGIYGNLQIMEMQMAQNKDFVPSIDAIKASVESAVEVVKQLSSVASESALRKRPLTADGIVKETADEIFEGKNIRLGFKTYPNLFKLDIDPDYSKHIIRSVLFLIREAVTDAGAIRIETANAVNLPPDIPRLDCKFIKISVEIDKKLPDAGMETFSSELDRVAATSLGYLLLKRNGGLVKVLSDKAIALFLPAVEH